MCLVLLAFQITVKLVFSQTSYDNVNISSGVYLQPTTWIKPALNFDGVNDRVKCNAESYPQQPLTLEAWIKVAHIVVGNEIIINVRYGRSSLYRSGTWVYFSFYDGVAFHSINTGAILNTSDWFHIVATKDNVNGMVIYVNTIPLGSDDSAGAKNATSFVDQIPRFGAVENVVGVWANFFEGSIDEVRIYNRVLSLSEIEYSYNNGIGYHTPYSTTDLELWLKLNENSGITAEDSSGNDNDGTIYGASWSRGKIVLGIVQNRYTLSSTTSVRNLTLNSGTLRLSKGSNAYEIACSTNDDVMITINKWFYSDITQFRPLAEVESTLSFTVNSRNKGEPQAISGVSSWSFDDDTTTMSLTTANYSLVTIRWESAGTQMVVWWLDRMMTWIGISGFFLIMLAPTMLVYYGKQDNWGNAFTYSLMFFVIGMALVIGWLWG